MLLCLLLGCNIFSGCTHVGFTWILWGISGYPRNIGFSALVQNSNPKRSFFLQILSQLWAKKCSLLSLAKDFHPWSKIQILNGVFSSKFSLNSELGNVHCSALPSHVCLYKTWWKYWKVSMRNPIETDFDVSLVSWFLTLKPDWPRYKLSNMFVMFFFITKKCHFPSISYYFHIPKIFLIFFPHIGKNRNRRKSNLLP